MEDRDCLVSAGRAVLELLEREWQPLSEGELDQRLDQAVEEVLEAELLTRLRSDAASAQLQQQREEANSQPQRSQPHTARAGPRPREQKLDGPLAGDDAAVQQVAALIEGTRAQGRMSGRSRPSLLQTQDVSLCLALIRERVSYRTISNRFHVEKGNVHRIFSSFCRSVNALVDQKIKWPRGAEAAGLLKPLHRLLESKVGSDVAPRVLGVLGHTRVPLGTPATGKHLDKPSLKRTKLDPDSWLYVELVCDHKGRILHCRVGPGSEVDRGSALSLELQQQQDLMPPASCLVAPPGYPLTAHILTPYAVCRGPAEELFNGTLRWHQRLLGRTVARLKRRFRRLECLDVAGFSRARDVVLTACVLHNVLLEEEEDDEEEEEEEEGDEEQEDKDQGTEVDEGLRRRDAVAELLFRLGSS